MKFTKMHGAGNDFIVLDCLAETLENPGTHAKKWCDRHFGIGADGLVLILPSTAGDFAMEIYNADGSRAVMCGNATRCVASYLHDRGLTPSGRIRLETGDGIKTLVLSTDGGGETSVRVDLGIPRWDPASVPVLLGGDRVIARTIDVDGTKVDVSCLSMGNPHCVVFTDDLSDGMVLGFGPKIERHPVFPDRTNVEFVRVISRTEVQVRVWERGCGETLACGTGSAAVCAAGFANGLTDRRIACRMTGGKLDVELVGGSEGEERIFMSGPAVEVFGGEMKIGNTMK